METGVDRGGRGGEMLLGASLSRDADLLRVVLSLSHSRMNSEKCWTMIGSDVSYQDFFFFIGKRIIAEESIGLFFFFFFFLENDCNCGGSMEMLMDVSGIVFDRVVCSRNKNSFYRMSVRNDGV